MNNLSTMTENESLDYVKKLLKTYNDLFQKFVKGDPSTIGIGYEGLVRVKESFPSKYMEKEDYEDLLLKASAAKFQAILVTRRFYGLYSDSNYELEYVTNNFKLYLADDALSEKFDKITEGLRDAYVNSKKEIKELTQLVEKIKIYAESSEKLIKMFDSDEVNFRRIEEKKKMMGFS